ncbi:MAG: biopolymer transporter ExbD [Myxococcales bacterium]|nr:biopolymer transporter ExbD [Myxococcales bacterium]
MNASLNLVPFIDLLSTLITFLIATAVWVELSSMPVDQALSDPNSPPPPPQDPPPPPPLTVHVRADGVWVGRKVEEGRNLAVVGESYDWEGVEKEIESDRRSFPDEEQVVLVTDDGVEYKHMIKALDLTRKYEYDKSLLGGGPAQPSTAKR